MAEPLVLAVARQEYRIARLAREATEIRAGFQDPAGDAGRRTELKLRIG